MGVTSSRVTQRLFNCSGKVCIRECSHFFLMRSTWIVDNTLHASRIWSFRIRLQIIISFGARRAVDSHECQVFNWIEFSKSKIFPRAAFNSRETLFIFIFYTFRPKAPWTLMTAQVDLSEQPIVSLWTSDLNAFAFVWPEINCARRNWCSINISIGVNYVNLDIRKKILSKKK